MKKEQHLINRPAVPHVVLRPRTVCDREQDEFNLLKNVKFDW